MALLFDDASAQDLINSSAVAADEPFSMGCWFYADDTANVLTCLSVGFAPVSSAGFHRLFLWGSSGDVVGAQSQNGTSGIATTSGSYTINTWHHGLAVFESNTARRAAIDGTFGTDNTNSVTVTASYTAIGRNAGNGTTYEYMSGRLAEVGFWNAALNASEAKMLAAGVSPLRVRPASLVAYLPLFDASGVNLAGSVGAFTPVNSPTIADHAPVAPPFGFDLGVPYEVAAAPGGLSIPIAAYHYNHNIGSNL